MIFFKILSSDAKILYGLMLDRMSLSIKNQWFDEQDRAYIYFSIEDIMELLNCGRNKAVKSLQELDDENGIGLIEKKRQGFGKANIIYVKSFMMEETEKEDSSQEEPLKFEKQTHGETGTDTEVYKTNFKKSQKQTSRSPENKLQEVYKSNSNYNNLSYLKKSDTESDLIESVEDGSDDDEDEDITMVQAYEGLIKEHIDYKSLLLTHPAAKDLVQGIFELILETVLCQNDRILIASNWYPAELVKSKFLKLNYSHIDYVMGCFQKNTTKVKNIKKYMLAALFNAPSTIEGYYTAEVNHDMPQFVCQGRG